MAPSFVTKGSSTFESLSYHAHQPKVNVDLDGQTEGLVSSYTTGDTIQGTVSINVDRDTRFDELEITFEGTSRTSVERVSMPGRTGAYQTFLRLRQPIEDSAYPTPRVLEQGRAYQFPFTFVVPDRLLPHACSHSKTNMHVERSHTLLPPTLGDAMLASNGKSILDDLSPDMSRIAYLVRVSILRKPVASNASPKTLVSVGKKVRIIPAVDEEPPLNVADSEAVYTTRKEKDVKRGLMRGKLGRLVVAASQPKPIQLSSPESPDSVSTAATVHLRFDPVANEAPPRLGTIWSKLRVSTFFSAEPWGDYPSPTCAMMWAQMGRGSYTETVPLSTMCIASAQWTRHDSTEDLNRCSSLASTSSSDSSSEPGPSASFTGPTFYTASVVVPISLPKSKAFVPTFHSCLISRVYALDLSVSYHTPNANILTPSASLRIPVQVTCRAKAENASKTGVDITQAEVNAEFFCARSVAPRRVDLAPPPPPPEYSEVRAPAVLSPDRSRDLISGGGVRV